ncbi:MAG: hypothetical protein MUF00_17315 [Gemmatimonadaceae bacterium]|jgi:hypothetical protein|nr:hypothetical protein [Gemmatimonadaceae bacterium]
MIARGAWWRVVARGGAWWVAHGEVFWWPGVLHQLVAAWVLLPQARLRR